MSYSWEMNANTVKSMREEERKQVWQDLNKWQIWMKHMWGLVLLFIRLLCNFFMVFKINL